MYWNPKRLKELKERGFKLRYMTLEEANAEVEEQAASVKPQAVKMQAASIKLQAARFKLQAASIKLLDYLPLVKFYLVKGEGLNHNKCILRMC